MKKYFHVIDHLKLTMMKRILSALPNKQLTTKNNTNQTQKQNQLKMNKNLRKGMMIDNKYKKESRSKNEVSRSNNQKKRQKYTEVLRRSTGWQVAERDETVTEAIGGKGREKKRV